YRPISLLSVFSKIFEKPIRTRLNNFFCRLKVLSDRQFGFREGRSTEDALLSVMSEIYEGINEGEKVAAVFLDLSKAFDTVCHRTLLKL
nr:reverse transcriptase, RT, PpernR1 {retrotransposon} [Phlebotomus perniciosus=sandflies, Peptide Transposon Partial, 88 aa] [Phlebotomus perniciosus]